MGKRPPLHKIYDSKTVALKLYSISALAIGVCKYVCVCLGGWNMHPKLRNCYFKTVLNIGIGDWCVCVYF